MRTMTFAAAIAIGLGGCSSPSPDQQAAADNAVATVQGGGTVARPTGFAALDADGDGGLTAAEHSTAAASAFAAMDGDNNGAVTAAEMTGDLSAIGGNQAMSVADRIKAVDLNTDTILSSAEHAAGAAAHFVQLDADRDGRVTQREFGAAQQGF